MSPKRLSRATKTFIAAVVAHATIDMCGSVWPIFKNLAHLDLAKAGLIATISASVTTVLQPLFGVYADRGHRRLLIVTGVTLICSMTLLGPIALWRDALGPFWLYLLMFLVLLVSRLGLAMFHPPGMSMAGNTSARRRSTSIAGFVTAGTVGVGVAWLVFSKTYTLTGGHTEWLLLPLAPVLVLVWLWCRPVEIHSQQNVTLRDILRQLAHIRRQLLSLYLVQAMMSGLLMGLLFLLPEFVAERGYPTWLSQWGAMLLMFAGGGLMMVPAGHLADRLGRRLMLICVIALSLGAYYAFVQLPPMPTLVFALLCMVTGACMQTANPMSIAIAQHLAPRNESMISGVMLGLAWALGSLAPAIVGYLATRPSVGVIGALTWLGIANAAALLLALCMPRLVPAATDN